MTTEEAKTLLYNIFGIEFECTTNPKYGYDVVNRFQSIDSRVIIYQHTTDITSPEYVGYNEYLNVHFKGNDGNFVKQKLINSKDGYISVNYGDNCVEFALFNGCKNLDI